MRFLKVILVVWLVVTVSAGICTAEGPASRAQTGCEGVQAQKWYAVPDRGTPQLHLRLPAGLPSARDPALRKRARRGSHTCSST